MRRATDTHFHVLPLAIAGASLVPASAATMRRRVACLVAAGALLAFVTVADIVEQPPLPAPEPEYEYIALQLHLDGEEPWWTQNYHDLALDTEYSSMDPAFVPFKTGTDKRLMWVGNGATKRVLINEHAAAIHFFGHAHAGLPLAGKHGEYEVGYVGGETSDPIELVSGTNIDDHCCNYSKQSLDKAPAVWVAPREWPDDPNHDWKRALVRRFTWENPEHMQRKVIRYVDFTDEDQDSEDTNPDARNERWPMLFAVTVEKPPLIAVRVPPGNPGSYYGLLGKEEDFIFSTGASFCALLTLYDPSMKGRFVAMAHMNQQTAVEASLEVMLVNYRGDPRNLRAYLAGAFDNPSLSGCMRDKVEAALERRGIKTTCLRRNAKPTAVQPTANNADAWAGFVDGVFTYCEAGFRGPRCQGLRTRMKQRGCPDRCQEELEARPLPREPEYGQCEPPDPPPSLCRKE